MRLFPLLKSGTIRCARRPSSLMYKLTCLALACTLNRYNCMEVKPGAGKRRTCVQGAPPTKKTKGPADSVIVCPSWFNGFLTPVSEDV